jgi:prephenate dehydrogenase
MTSHVWNRATIVGCGLIGASFALALKERGICRLVAGWDSEPRVLDEALKLGVIDEVDPCFRSASATPSASDLIYLAMPVRDVISFLKDMGSHVKPDAVVTDTGSTKVEICRIAKTHLPKDRHFIGGHPIAGSHLSGLSHARADLFAGAPYILIGENADESTGFLKVKQTVAGLGSQVYRMRASQHDRVMSLLSHLPQVTSIALRGTVRKRLGSDFFMKVAGTGYEDMTRLAESSWSIWEDILRTNAGPIADALEGLSERLCRLGKELRRLETDRTFELPETRRLFKPFKEPQDRRGSVL